MLFSQDIFKFKASASHYKKHYIHMSLMKQVVNINLVNINLVSYTHMPYPDIHICIPEVHNQSLVNRRYRLVVFLWLQELI